MTREELERAIDAWDPAGEDLPDEVALALDGDADLRARFDARFARMEAEPSLVPRGLEERVLPARPKRRTSPWWVAVSALVAASLALPAVVGYRTFTRYGAAPEMAGPEPVVVDAAPTPDRAEGTEEEPLVALGYVDPGRSERWRLGKAKAAETTTTLEAEMGEMLEALGYADGKRVTGHVAPGYFATDATVDAANVPTTGDGFVDHGVSPFQDVGGHPLSTFSIDVDRGSYTWARRQLREGFLPDPASVRTEEFVNSLTYDAPQPDGGPFVVQVEGSPSPFSSAELVRLTVAARDATDRKPVHLTFLVDTSGSMSGEDRLPLVKRSLGLLVEQLRDGDTVAIVAYAGSAGVVLPPIPATDQRAILGALDRLEAGGSTAMGQGIQLAYDLARQAMRPGHTNRVVIASDGDANVGTTNTGSLSAAIRGYALEGITLTTLGFGAGNYQDARMEQLANDGDGAYYYVDGLDEARRVFVDELTSTLEVVARDVKVQVAWDPATVRSYRLIGYENRALRDQDFADDRIDAGEVGAGHTVTALYEIERVPGATGDLGVVHLRGKPPGPDAPSTEWTTRMPAGAMQPTFALASADHRMAVTTATFAERLRKSPYVVGTSFADLHASALDARRPGHAEDDEVVELTRRAAELSGDGLCRDVSMISGGVKRMVLVDDDGRPCGLFARR